jgi:hypothetical protein
MTRRPRPWIRFLGWFGFAALFLATCVVVTRALVIRGGHAKIERLVARPLPSAPPVPDSGAPTATLTNAPEPAVGRVLLSDLPLVSMAFSDDPAVRGEFAKLLADLDKIICARAPSWTVINFKLTLKGLGISVPDSMTEAEAAAAFLREMEPLSDTLAQLRSALEKGNWEWGKWDGAGEWSGWQPSESNRYRMQIHELLRHAGAVMSAIMQARWRAGNANGAWSDWEMVRLLADRAGDDTSPSGADWKLSIHAQAAHAVGLGIALDGWTDDQLARFPQALASYNALEVSRRGLQADLNYLNDFSQRPTEVRSYFGEYQSRRAQGVGSLIRHVTSNVTSDQQIQDNLAVITSDYEFALARLDVHNRVYVPPAPGERSPAVEIVADQSALSNYYFMPFKDRVAWSERQASFADFQYGVRNQVRTDYARLAAALELERRSSDEYPDALDAVSPAFPSGMPHDVATGRPYFYERTPEGSYRIWSTGIDQTNNNGDPKKDIVFTLPRVE